MIHHKWSSNSFSAFTVLAKKEGKNSTGTYRIGAMFDVYFLS